MNIVLDLVLTAVMVLGFYAYFYVIRCYYDVTLFELLYYRKMPLKGANAGPFVKEIPGILISVGTAYAIVLSTDFIFNLKFIWSFVALAGIVVVLGLLIYHYKAISFLVLTHSHTKLYEQDYADPQAVKVQFPEKKRNLVYIFMESMETCYSSLQNGKVDYMKELSALAKEGADFSGQDGINGAFAIPGATFTTGAMVSHLSGVPIGKTLPGSKHGSKDFLPGLTMLGDILKEEGYQQEFILGSDIKFGGREPLMRGHGDCEIFDYKTAKKKGCIPMDYHVFWGHEDEKLFDHARREAKRLAAGSQPFALTLLTVDTHFLDGYKCRLCPDTFSDQYANAIACSSKQVSDFVAWLKTQPFYENTTIVLAGDHPTMDSGFIKRSGLRGQARRSYVTYLNVPEGMQEHEHQYTTMDLFPTTVASLGAKIEGDRLGLGTNLFSDQQTLMERLGKKKLDNELTKISNYYKKFYYSGSKNHRIVHLHNLRRRIRSHRRVK